MPVLVYSKEEISEMIIEVATNKMNNLDSFGVDRTQEFYKKVGIHQLANDLLDRLDADKSKLRGWYHPKPLRKNYKKRPVRDYFGEIITEVKVEEK